MDWGLNCFYSASKVATSTQVLNKQWSGYGVTHVYNKNITIYPLHTIVINTPPI